MTYSSAWQPIETAPKTHSIIVWEEGVMGEAYYDHEEKSWWWANTAPYDFDACKAIYPTLWHPMPIPPRLTMRMGNEGLG